MCILQNGHEIKSKYKKNVLALNQKTNWIYIQH